MIRRRWRVLVVAAVTSVCGLIADRSSGGTRLGARPSASEEPVLSVAMPGMGSARFEVPNARRLSRLSLEAIAELQAVGGGTLVRRAVSAQVALGETAVREATRRRERETGAGRAARIVRELFERLGVTYVKMGQLIASSPSAFPAEVIAEFERCLDSAPPVDSREIRRVVEASLDFERVFASFDPDPIATASIAQVHRATLRDGRRVVVKVRKPGVDDVLRCDLAVLKVAASWLEAFAPEMRRVDPAGLAEELRASALAELDFETEADRLDRFAAFLADAGLDAVVTVPRPILATKAVLVMTALDGAPLADAPPRAARTERAVADLVRVWALSVTAGPFFHADMHPGNVLLLRDGTLGLLDFGVVGHLPARTYSSVLAMAAAYDARDSAALAAALRDLGVLAEPSPRHATEKNPPDRDLAPLAADLHALLFAPPTGASGASSTRAAAAAVQTIVDIAERNALQLPREFSLLVKQALYLDRYISALAPDLDVFADPALQLRRQAEGPPPSPGRP